MNGKLCLTVSTIVLGMVSFHGPLSGTTEPGSCIESWQLENFQPQSETYEQTVASSSYQDRTTVVMLLASW